MKNILNIWNGTTLFNEIEKQKLSLAKAMIVWGIVGTITGAFAIAETKEITFATFVFIFLQLLIKVSTVGIYEGDEKTTVDKAILKSELFANKIILATSIIFYIIFSGALPLMTVIISLIMFGISLKSYKK